MCLGMTWYQLESCRGHGSCLTFIMTAKPVSYETFSLSERQYPWRFCVSKGWNVHPKGESSMVVSGLDV